MEYSNCILIGLNAGADLTTENGVVIIGDNIRSFDRSKNNDVIFFQDKMAIGKTIFGKPCNLYDLIAEFLKQNPDVKRTGNI